MRGYCIILVGQRSLLHLLVNSLILKNGSFDQLNIMKSGNLYTDS